LVQPRHRRLRQGVKGLAATLAPIARQAIRSSPPDDLMRLAMRTSRDLDPAMNDRSDRLDLHRLRVRSPDRLDLRFARRVSDAASAALDGHQRQHCTPNLREIQALHPGQPNLEFLRSQARLPNIVDAILAQINRCRY